MRGGRGRCRGISPSQYVSRFSCLFLALALALTVVAGRANPAAAATQTVPGTVAADCSRDVTKALSDWIAGVPDGSTLSFAGHGCYRIDGTLLFEKRHDLTFEGNGATLKAGTDGDRDRVHLLFLGGGGITIRDLTVKGANAKAGATAAAYRPDRAFQHAFAFRGVDGAVLDHVAASALYGDFVYVGDDVDTHEWSHDITVEHSHFDGSGRQGISVTAGDHVTIEHNVIRNVARSMFDLEPNSDGGGAKQITIADNVTGRATNFWIASKGSSDDLGNITVRDNVMQQPTGGLIWVYGVLPDYRGPFTITGNTLRTTGEVNDEETRGAFFFARCDGVTISDNKVLLPSGGGMPVVEVRDSRHVELASNNVIKNGGTRVLDTSPAFPTPDQR